MKPRSAHVAPPLHPRIVAILLGGWLSTPGGAEDVHGFGDGLFELFVENDAGLARLWREHEPFLRAEAARLGIKPTWRVGRRTYFFADAVSRKIAARASRIEHTRGA